MAEEQQGEILLSQERDFWGSLKLDLQELQGISRLVYELIQNADDVKKPDGSSGGASQISFDITDEALICENDGVFSNCGNFELPECPWKESKGHRCDFHRIKIVGGMDKRQEENTTGAFGIGFNSVYQITDHPEIISSGWRWILRPEEEQKNRIKAFQIKSSKGTKFILPWAFDPKSKVRKELSGVPAVKSHQVNEFVSQIADALSRAAIFLRQIKKIQLLRSGKPITTIERVQKGNEIEIIIDQTKITYELFRGDFEGEAKQFKQDFNGLIESTRNNQICIAIPKNCVENGYLYAFLPTEMKSGMPFHIQADFYPSANRRNILLDDSVRSKWNRLAIESTAHLLINNFDEISNLFDPVPLWDWINLIYQGSKQNPIDPSFEVYWSLLKDILPNKEIMLTPLGKKVTLFSSRLLRTAERPAEKQLESLGINIVNLNLLKYYPMFQEIGVPEIEIKDIIDRFEDNDFTHRVSFKELPKPVSTEIGFSTLLSAINLIWNRTSEKNLYIDSLCKCSIALCIDEYLYPPNELFIGSTDIQTVFPNVFWFKPIENCAPIPVEIIDQFTVFQLIDYLENIQETDLKKLLLGEGHKIERLYIWLEKQQDEIQKDPDLRDRLRSLRIWPAGKTLASLNELYLPGDFEDPISLTSLIDISQLGGKSDFLRNVLGVKTLDLKTYVTEQIPLVFKSEPTNKELVKKIVELLSVHLSRIKDDLKCKHILRDLPLVECQDKGFHLSSEVYFDNQKTRILGDGFYYANNLIQTTIIFLNEWLGVSELPKYIDINNRIDELVSKKPNPKSISQIESIFLYLGELWERIHGPSTYERNEFEKAFDDLKRKRWLPGSCNKDQWFSPDILNSRFNSFLFESQGNFLEIDFAIQRKTREFINFLVINNEPKPMQIVKHIIYCSENSIAVNKEVYRYLNFEKHLLDHEALSELIGKACVLQSENPVRYVKPNSLFWNDHPFGKYRYKLGEGNRAYENLFKFLGVKDVPTIEDFIQVLIDIREVEHTNRLEKETIDIIMSCWRSLSSALAEGEITKEQRIEKISGESVIPDPRGVLCKPFLLFFEDRVGLVEKFPGLENNVIQRTEGCWLAMEAVGVNLMSTKIVKEPLTQIDSTSDEILFRLISERKTLIQRIIDAEKVPDSQIRDSDYLLNLDFQKAEELEVKMTFNGFRKPIPSGPELMDAVLIEDRFYTIWSKGSPVWPAVGRELALALKPSGETGSLAMGIMSVLAAETQEDAKNILDDLNFPPLIGYEEPDISEIPEIELTASQAQEAVLGGIQPPAGSEIPPEFVETTPPEISKQPITKVPVSPKQKRKTSRLVSYVYPDWESFNDNPKPKDYSGRTKTEIKGVEIVISDEKQNNRLAIDKNIDERNHPGYDVESIDQETGVIRYIEIKALKGLWDSSNPIHMTKNEFLVAQEQGPKYWLYIVEKATSEDHLIYRIQDPSNRSNYFLFDHGWMDLSVDY